MLALAYFSEKSLEERLQDVYIALPTTADEDVESGRPLQNAAVAARPKFRKPRRWSTPPAYLSISAESERDSANGPPLPPPSAEAGHSIDPLAQSPTTGKIQPSSRHVSFGVEYFRPPASAINDSVANEVKYKMSGASDSRGKHSTIRPRLPHDRAEKIRLWLGVAYGSASGTLSGICLLFAKTGVELLIMTVLGHNQFKRWESWMIVLALLICVLYQVSTLPIGEGNNVFKQRARS